MDMNLSVIIPAYNEASRIQNVLKVVTACDFVDEIIVVDDGSTDGTAAMASKCQRAHVLRLPINGGKGAAVAAGVRFARGEVCLLLDADLSGLTEPHVRSLMAPLFAGQCDMTLGVLSGGNFWSDAGQGVSPALSGQRALRRDTLVNIPGLNECRMGVEVLINLAIRQQGGRITRIPLEGVNHALKEQKMGWYRGISARCRMYREIGMTLLRIHRRQRPVKVS